MENRLRDTMNGSCKTQLLPFPSFALVIIYIIYALSDPSKRFNFKKNENIKSGNLLELFEGTFANFKNSLLYLERTYEGNALVIRCEQGTVFCLGHTTSSIFARVRHSKLVYVVLVYLDVRIISTS